MPIVAASADSAQTSVAEKRTLWQKVKAEILHYYHGFRLLFLDMKISAKLIWRIVNGKELSRREHRLVRCMLLSELSVILFCFVFYPSNFTKMISHDLIFLQLVKTTGDMFRLIPFSVFIIVPFMELLLPVVIKFFPGMLPSTFQTATDKEDKLKQALKVIFVCDQNRRNIKKNVVN